MSPLSSPPAVYATDLPIEALGTAELLLVTSLRLFADAWIARGEDRPDWRCGLLTCGAPTWTASAFDGLLGVIVVAAHRPLDVRCPRCAALGSDEGRFLQVISLFQHGRPDEGAAALGDWLPPAAQRLAAPPADGLARALSQAGLVVPWRHPAAAMFPTVRAERGSALTLVH